MFIEFKFHGWLAILGMLAIISIPFILIIKFWGIFLILQIIGWSALVLFFGWLLFGKSRLNLR